MSQTRMPQARPPGAAVPSDEAGRLIDLHALGLLDTPPEERFDRITRTTARLFQAPIVLISLVDVSRQWFKSCLGLGDRETSRDVSFCAHAILGEEAFVIEDALQDERFAANPLVTGEPHIRFYAGQPVRGGTGKKVGTLCVIDRLPRRFEAADRAALADLGAMVEREMQATDMGLLLAEKQESEARFQAVFENSGLGIVLLDGKGRAVQSNGAAQRILGYTAEEFRIMPFSDYTFSEDLGTSQDSFMEMLAGKRDSYSTEKRYIRKDGSLMWGRVTISLLGDAGGRPQLALGMFADISQQKQTELELASAAVDNRRLLAAVESELAERKRTEAELKEQYREADRARGQGHAVLDATTEAMVLVSPERRFLTMNQRFSSMFGQNPDDVIGRRFDEFEAEVERVFEDPAGFRRRMAGTASDADNSFTEIVRQRYPVEAELELFSTPVRTADGEHLGRLYVFRDVTREREVDRMKSEFISMVSHELRTPLTSIKGYVDLLLEDGPEHFDPEQVDFLGIVKNNADRLIALINDLLDVSRIEAGKVVLERTPVDISRLIHGVARSLRTQIDQKGQILNLDLADSLPSVLGDSDRITQILTNLLSNAHKYTPQGGLIRVTAVVDRGWLRVDVEDTGVGLSPDEQSQIFTRFFRARNRLTQEVGGTGLGLAITHSLVQMHGGQIVLSSTPGEGSTFRFTLPIATERPSEPAGAPGQRAGARILVIEDEPDIAGLIRRYLERSGYTVFIAGSAAEGLRLAEREQPDLITLDLALPDLSGEVALSRLQANPRTANTPVIVLSVSPREEGSRPPGVMDYIVKPVREAVLVDCVNAILAGHPPAESAADG
jgi:PAS domain S-box-containing protein